MISYAFLSGRGCGLSYSLSYGLSYVLTEGHSDSILSHWSKALQSTF